MGYEILWAVCWRQDCMIASWQTPTISWCFFFSKFFSVPYYWIYVSFVSLQLSITSTAMKEISVLMTRTEWSCWRSISVGGKRGGQPRLRTTAAYIYIAVAFRQHGSAVWINIMLLLQLQLLCTAHDKRDPRDWLLSTQGVGSYVERLAVRCGQFYF
jgi:hypothetical protein